MRYADSANDVRLQIKMYEKSLGTISGDLRVA